MALQSVRGTWGIGPWKLQDFGVTELFNTATGRDTSNPTWNNPAVYQATVGGSQPTAQQKQSTTITGGGPQPVLTNPKTTTNTSSQTTGGGGGGDSKLQQLSKMDRNPAQESEYQRMLEELKNSGPDVGDLARQQGEAARAAAEAKRVAARNRYGAQVKIAEDAKATAKGEYDWMVETLGSNKKDLLEQVATNEKEGLANYQQQEAKTKVQYDGAKQEILSTYRDLGKQQEKLMRGAGLQNSSRMMEAQNRLNALMGKDLSQVTTNEADAIAMIGNAVSALKNKTLDTINSIERESKSKLDKAALDYNTQVKAIDANLYLSANEREDAYNAAEAQLADDKAKIATWAAGVKASVETQKMQLKAQLDQFILSMTDAKGLLTQGLGEKAAATNSYVSSIGFNTKLDTETGAQKTTGLGAGRTAKPVAYKSAEEIQNALNQGQISVLEAQEALASLNSGATADPLLAALGAGPTANASATMRQNDPLLAAMF